MLNSSLFLAGLHFRAGTRGLVLGEVGLGSGLGSCGHVPKVSYTSDIQQHLIHLISTLFTAIFLAHSTRAIL